MYFFIKKRFKTKDEGLRHVSLVSKLIDSWHISLDQDSSFAPDIFALRIEFPC